MDQKPITSHIQFFSVIKHDSRLPSIVKTFFIRHRSSDVPTFNLSPMHHHFLSSKRPWRIKHQTNYHISGLRLNRPWRLWRRNSLRCTTLPLFVPRMIFRCVGDEIELVVNWWLINVELLTNFVSNATGQVLDGPPELPSVPKTLLLHRHIPHGPRRVRRLVPLRSGQQPPHTVCLSKSQSCSQGEIRCGFGDRVWREED